MSIHCDDCNLQKNGTISCSEGRYKTDEQRLFDYNKKHGWISIIDKLPEDHNTYIVQCENEYIGFGYLSSDNE